MLPIVSNGPFVMMDKLKTATEAVDFYLCAQKNQTILIQYALDILFQSFRGYFNRQIIFAFQPAQRGIESKRDDRVNCIKAFCQPEYVSKFSTHWHTEKCTKSASSK